MTTIISENRISTIFIFIRYGIVIGTLALGIHLFFELYSARDYNSLLSEIVNSLVYIMVLSYAFIFLEDKKSGILSAKSPILVGLGAIWWLCMRTAMPFLLFLLAQGHGPTFELIIFSFPLTTMIFYIVIYLIKNKLPVSDSFDVVCLAAPIVHFILAIFAAR